MINKKNMWFLTLFSLILVLSVYYITMPTELLLNTGSLKSETETKNVDVEEESENATLVALRVEKEEETIKELDALNGVLMNKDSSVEEKNNAYDKMKDINSVKGEETSLEKKVKDELKLDSVIKIKGDQIHVSVCSEEKNTALANKIMRTIQSEFKNKMFITVKFEQ